MAKYRIYMEGLSRGRTLHTYDNYDEARADFDAYKRGEMGRMNNAVLLQVNKPSEAIPTYMETIERYAAPGWDEEVDAYWKRKEAEEEDWHAGDAPWKAPGMSIHDFF